jgi:nitrite reductase/ring-hydroxylating ferredoxin subunit
MAPDAASGGAVLCAVADVAEGVARGFVVGEGHARRDVVVVRVAGTLACYANRCPHRGTPLETFPDRFLDADGMLVCSTHGARFRPGDGYCVSGPCIGQALQPVAFDVRDGVIVLRG